MSDDRDLSSNLERELHRVMKEHPELNDSGMGLPFVPGQDYSFKLGQEREDLIRNLAHIEMTVNWLKEHIRPIQSINRNISSYGLKHLVERHQDQYITNGIFIAAAIIAGYRFKKVERSINVCFGMSYKSIHEMDLLCSHGRIKKAGEAPRPSARIEKDIGT